MARPAKQYVHGYYVLKGGKPCILGGRSLHKRGVLLRSKNGDDVTVVLRNDRSLQATYAHAERLIAQTMWAVIRVKEHRTSMSSPVIEEIFAPGRFKIISCRTKIPPIPTSSAALRLQSDFTSSSVAMSSLKVLLTPKTKRMSRRSPKLPAVLADL